MVIELARRMAASAEGLTLNEMAAQLNVGRRTAERMRDAAYAASIALIAVVVMALVLSLLMGAKGLAIVDVMLGDDAGALEAEKIADEDDFDDPWRNPGAIPALGTPARAPAAPVIVPSDIAVQSEPDAFLVIS